MNGLLTKLPVAVTDTSIPILRKDSWIDDGAEFLFDGGRTLSWSSQANPVNGSIIYNLVDGKPNAEVNSSGSNLLFREGGFDFIGVGTPSIYTGGVNDYRLADLGNPDFVLIAWFKREIGFSTGDFQNIIGRNSSNTTAANNEVRITTNSGGLGLWTTVVEATGPTSRNRSIPNETVTALLGTTMQIAISVEAGQLSFYLNGAIVTSVAFTKPYNSPSGQRLRSGAGIGGQILKGILKRWGMTKLGYGKTAIEKVLQDYNNNRVRLQATD